MSAERGPTPSETLGPYILEGIIGAGGFGTVYRARDAGGRRVALKVLAPHVDSEETLRRFEREGTIRIDHPNVVRVLDAGSASGVSYIAFELLEGKPLIALLEQAPLPAERVIDIGLQIGAGLEAAHARGVVHRDLKPGNVFVCDDGALKILDFGIARPMSQAGPQLTMAGSVIGTPGYLAPEQARGEPNITAATDIWSLGVILYQAASGTSPFMRSTAVATILAVVLEEPLPLGQLGTLPRGMAEIIHRCLHKDPGERWPSAEVLTAALRAIDVRGSRVVSVPSELTTSIPAGEQRVVALLLAVDVHDLASLDAAVRDWGGELIPMLGGQAIGVFGGRTYEGDEGLRAVRAAVAAREAAGHVAVASGHATGSGGTVSGAVVREVERLASERLRGVAVDARVARIANGHVQLRRVRADLFEVPRTFRLADTGSFAAVREDVPLLDREVELAQLERAIETALDDERATVVWVHGPPGIGKSRLRAELERRLRERRVPMLVSRGESHRRDAAFHLLAGALESHPELEPVFLDASVPTPHRRRALEHVLARVLDDAVWARQCIEPIARLLGVPDALEHATTHRRSDPQHMADRARVSLGDVLTAMGAREPFALVLDDVQWADEASLLLADELTGRLARRPFLLFVAARGELEERQPELFAQREVVRIGPRGLGAPAVATLAENIARRPVPAPIVDEVAARTGGNPFFVEQIVRELVEQDLLDGELRTLPIPIDVEAAVQSRLDHLPTDEKQLCKRAAVYAGAFTAPSLVALGSSDPAPHLASLTRRGLVSSRAVKGSEREYRFKNALVAEVAYRMNSEDARLELHRAAAAFLTTIAGADLEELARHRELGGEPQRAAETYAEAAGRAARRGDSRSVLRCGARAIELGLSGSAAFELHLARADACSFLGRRDEQREAIEAAVSLAGDPLMQARALTEKVGYFAAIGAHDDGLAVAEQAVRTAREVADPDVLATALTRRGWLLLYSGRVAEAAESIQEASSLSARLAPETAAFVAVWRGQLVTAMGDLGKRKAAYEEAVARFREIGDLRRAASAECNLADTYNRVGAYEDAEAALREALESCKRVGNRVVEGYALANLGYALAGQERWAEALETFGVSLQLATELGRPRLALAVRLYRARAMLDAGEPAAGIMAEARAIAEAARAELLPALQATALALASRAALNADEREGALQDAERAMALRDEIGAMEEDEAEVFLAFADALRASGELERAREVVARGASRLEFLAGRIADTDWRARFLVEVPMNRRLIELDGAV